MKGTLMVEELPKYHLLLCSESLENSSRELLPEAAQFQEFGKSWQRPILEKQYWFFLHNVQSRALINISQTIQII